MSFVMYIWFVYMGKDIGCS